MALFLGDIDLDDQMIFMNDGLLPIIKTLVHNYPLKGADAVHLASALWLGRSLKENLVFMASDQMLLKAALSEKLLVLDPAAGREKAL